MNRKHWLLSLCAVPVATVAVAFALQEGDAQGGDMSEMFAKPTEHHRVLEQMAGTWNAAMEFPGMDPHQGVETSKVAMNGLWLVGDFEMADFMGMPFHGHSITGYDATKEKYVGLWIDSLTDRMTVSEGTYDARTKQLVMHAENLDHMTGEMRKERHVTEFTGPDTRVFKMIPEGSDEPTMVIHYTRKK